jgi:hypothetical protein
MIERLLRTVMPGREPPTPVPMIVSCRTDGLGQRLNALLNTIYLARTLGIDYGFAWKALAGGHAVHHSIGTPEDIFDPVYLDRHYVPELDEKMPQLSTRGLSISDLKRVTTRAGFKGWRSKLRLELKRHSADPYLIEGWSVGVARAFEEIKFAGPIQSAISAARARRIPDNAVAIHLRAGDVVYGAAGRSLDFVSKIIPPIIAEEVMVQLKGRGFQPILFGQDALLLTYLAERHGAALATGDDAVPAMGPFESVFYEIALMARTKLIVAGDSGFPRLASWIGGCSLADTASIVEPARQVAIVLNELPARASDYPAKQVAISYLVAYGIGKSTLGAAEKDRLLELACEADPHNAFYGLRRASDAFRVEEWERGDAFLAQLLTKEYQGQPLMQLASVRVLMQRRAAAGPRRYVLYDDFGPIQLAAKRGLAHAAFYSALIRQLLGDASGAQRYAEMCVAAQRQSPLFAALREDAQRTLKEIMA